MMFFPCFAALTIATLPLLAMPTLAAAEPSHLIRLVSENDLPHWEVIWNEDKENAVAFSKEYANGSNYSVLFTAPRYEVGQPEWPVWDTVPQIADWRAYDRLVFDIVNPTGTAAKLYFRVADESQLTTPRGKLPTTYTKVHARSYSRMVVPISEKPWTGQDLTQMARISFNGQRPMDDLRFYISNFRLLKPGEPLPPLSKDYLKQISDLGILPLQQKVKAQFAKTAAIVAQAGEEMAWSRTALGELSKERTALEAKVATFTGTEMPFHELGGALALLANRVERLALLVRLGQQSQATFGHGGYTVGWAGSTAKVRPQAMPPHEVEVRKEALLKVAGNESAHVQIAVAPWAASLKNVRVKVSSLVNSQGEALPKEAVDVRTVGFVKTIEPDYPTDYVGWWPDPLLDFLDAVDVPEQEVQTFWVRVRTPEKQQPGLYRGTVTVSADGVPPTELALNVQVRHFSLSKKSPLPLATAFAGEHFFRQFTDRPWEELKFEVADFLADYFIDFNSIYREGPPDFEVLEYLHQKGTLSAFSIGTLGFNRNQNSNLPTVTSELLQSAEARWEEMITPAYEEARRRGLAHLAYSYGLDEINSNNYDGLRAIAQAFKAKYPDLPLASSALDSSLGVTSRTREVIDIWVPRLNHYDIATAEQARAQGRTVWWYTCLSPANPFPNFFTENPAMEIRLLMGAMSAKYQPDGFLYYSIFRYQNLNRDDPPRTAVDDGPYTSWNACAFGQPFNGEGYWAYPGPDGKPLASLRLENLRDGLEDLAYWQLLSRKVEEAKRQSGADEAWLAKAEQALEVPQALVTAMNQFSTDAALLEKWRDRLADLIEERPDAAEGTLSTTNPKKPLNEPCP